VHGFVGRFGGLVHTMHQPNLVKNWPRVVVSAFLTAWIQSRKTPGVLVLVPVGAAWIGAAVLENHWDYGKTVRMELWSFERRTKGRPRKAWHSSTS
jgi:hypothetical protein